VHAGLRRCGKSCRLRWLNYLRPNIKRGNISYDEEDLIIRLHKLLGNRSPGRASGLIPVFLSLMSSELKLLMHGFSIPLRVGTQVVADCRQAAGPNRQ
jgi:hypothetical protein